MQWRILKTMKIPNYIYLPKVLTVSDDIKIHNNCIKPRQLLATATNPTKRLHLIIS